MKLRALLTLAFAGLVAVTPAHGQEGGLLSPETGLMVWTLIVFAIVLTVLYKFVYPPILGAVEAREQQIRDLLAAAAKDRADAQVALEEHTRQLDETRAKIHELVAEGRTAGERMRDEIVADGRRQAEEIIVRARRDVRQELDRAMQEMRAEAVDLALVAASKLIDRNLDDDDNRRLVREYLTAIETSKGSRVVAGV
jgi:F-type H+-transporting ATPase subunit b